MPQCPQSYGIKIQSLVCLVTFLLGSGHSSVHIALGRYSSVLVLGRSVNSLCFAKTQPSPTATPAAACQYQFTASQTVTILESVYGDSPTVQCRPAVY